MSRVLDLVLHLGLIVLGVSCVRYVYYFVLLFEQYVRLWVAR